MLTTLLSAGGGRTTAAAFLGLILTFVSADRAKADPTAAPFATSVASPSEDPEGAVKTVQVTAAPVAIFEGKAEWDAGFVTIVASFGKIRAELAKAGLKPAGHPFAAFVETDDKGFEYQAMIPIGSAPAGKNQLSPDVRFGLSPSGSALKFEHRGPYDDIDATYEAITAYLDEKGLEAKDLFIEQYLTDARAPADASLAVDIYIFVK